MYLIFPAASILSNTLFPIDLCIDSCACTPRFDHGTVGYFNDWYNTSSPTVLQFHVYCHLLFALKKKIHFSPRPIGFPSFPPSSPPRLSPNLLQHSLLFLSLQKRAGFPCLSASHGRSSCHKTRRLLSY